MKKLTIILLSLCWLSLSATSWRVNNNPAIDADFDDLNAAIAAASENDTLYVEGTQFSYGDILLNKRLVVIGPGYFLDENDSTQVSFNPAETQLFHIDTLGSGSHVYGLQINEYCRIGGSEVVFSRNYMPNSPINLGYDNDVMSCVISQNFVKSITYTGSGTDVLNVLVANNYCTSSIDFHNGCSAIVMNNIVQYSIDVHNSIVKNNIKTNGNNGSIFINTNNVFAYNIINYQSGGVPPGPGNIVGIDPDDIFIDYYGNLNYSTDGKWQLKEGSLAIGYGENGVDCGMFGGTSPYVLSGLAPVPHIYEAIVPVSGSAASGLTVTIKVKSQN